MSTTENEFQAALASNGDSPSSNKDSKKQNKNKQKGRKGIIGRVVLSILALVLIFAAALSVFCATRVWAWLQDVPDCSDLSKYTQTGIATIYASDGKTVLAEITQENRIEVSSSDMSQYIKDAVVAIEDERFYEHGALDPMGIARAIVSNIKGNRQGASTLTQQLARNTVLLNEMSDQTLERKVREAYIAYNLEQSHSKDEILESYLNVVNFANANYGIEAASQDYFGMSAKNLSLAQAALLAGIPNSPSLYDPRNNLDAALSRQKVVLDKMEELGFITPEEKASALEEDIEISKVDSKKDHVYDIAPYFVDYIKQLLEDDPRYDVRGSIGGSKIYTTLNVKDQKAAKRAVNTVMKGSDLDASLTSVDPENGYILAMIGGRNYTKDNFNLSTQMNRQPGSTFKPFTLIAAMQLGIDPLTRYDATAPAKITSTWTVNNAEGGGSGYMSLLDATTHSVNTVYARLAHEIGSDVIVDTAHSMGIKSNLTNDETITLGTSGVNTLEMASAYATLASGGIYHEPVAITRIENGEGRQIYEITEEDIQGTRVLSESIAAKATEVLKTVVERGTGAGARLSNGQVAAGKTGTSEHGRDLWFVAYTPQISCAVWTGYREEKETSLYGGTTSVPIWKQYVESVLGSASIEEFAEPDDDAAELVFTTTASDLRGESWSGKDSSNQDGTLAYSDKGKNSNDGAERGRVTSVYIGNSLRNLINAMGNRYSTLENGTSSSNAGANAMTETTSTDTSENSVIDVLRALSSSAKSTTGASASQSQAQKQIQQSSDMQSQKKKESSSRRSSTSSSSKSTSSSRDSSISSSASQNEKSKNH